MNRKPKLSDYYDTSDPRGASRSEYEDYERDLKKWERSNNGSSNNTDKKWH